MLGCLWASSAQAFIHGDPDFEPWLSTTAGSRSGNGQPLALTWSLVDDGTSTPGLSGPRVGSDLISMLDTTLGGTPSPQQANDLTARPWFDLFRQTFDRWEALSGVDFTYEPTDDGASLGNFSGETNIRGDIRIGGRNIDGTGNTVAFAFPPAGISSDGDIVMDTSETAFFGNAGGNFRRLRNTIAHEVGHSLNLDHVVSSTDALLLEPAISTSFDGPQLDEVRAVHFFYGDFNEKSNNGLGNDVATRATPLGTISAGAPASIGTDANVPTQSIGSAATNFVSISNLDDADFFSFTITEPGRLDALLTPLGGTFTQGGQFETPTAFDANARIDLALTIFDTNGTTPLVIADDGGLGASESLQDVHLSEAGAYFARVTGAADTIQLYQLNLSVEPVVFLDADFNEDLSVDTADLAILETAFGSSATGDSDGDGDTDNADFLTWQLQFGIDLGAVSSPTAAIPEPTSVVLLLLGLATRRRKV